MAAQIDTSLISTADIQNLAITFLGAVKKFYEDPRNEEMFQAWKRQREEKACLK